MFQGNRSGFVVETEAKKVDGLTFSRKTMDLATVLGCILGLVVIIGTMLSEGNLGIFFNIPAIAIVFGGMTCATMIHFSMKQFLGVFSVVKKTLFHKLPEPKEAILEMANFATINRRDGALALEQEVAKIKDPFMAKGIQMIVDGQEENHIRERIGLEIQYTLERHGMGRKIMEFMGASSPSFAMVGTLIGLVNMLSEMEDPSKIGEGMACALVCTFYGAFIANMFFLPMAGKLGQYSKMEGIHMEMLLEGLCAIVRGESPSAVREIMQVFVSAKRREELKTKAK
jgi:chemotaxis protein MotA